MLQFIKRTMSVLLVLLFCAVPALPAAASDVGFSVSPILPDNQLPETSGFFDLLMEPGQTQTLAVEIANNSGEAMTVSVEALTASTNMNGLINYTSPGWLDETLSYAFTDLAAIEQASITLAAGSSTRAFVELTMPDELFDGIVLGSIQVTKELGAQELENAGAIINQYSYVIGVRLRMTDAEIAPDFALGEIRTELTNYRASVVTGVRNVRPVLIKGAEARAEIVREDGGEPLLERELANLDIAPNSVLPLTLIDGDGKGLPAGDYLARVRLEYQGQVWSFEEGFSIEAETAAAINESAVNQDTPTAGLQGQIPLWALVLIATGTLLLIVLIILLVVLLRRQKAGKNDPAAMTR